jgi:hypothetical protein
MLVLDPWRRLSTYLDGKDDVETIVKRLDRPCRSATVETDTSTVNTHHARYSISIRSDSNLKLCVFYLKHQAGVTRVLTAGGITLEMVRGFKDQQRGGMDYKKTTVEPVINDKECPRALENIRDYLATILVGNGSHLAYVVITDVVVPDAAEYPADSYLTVDQEIIHHDPHSGPAIINDNCTVWDVMFIICGQHECWIYIKPVHRANDGRKAYELLFDHYLGPNNEVNMVSSADTKLTSTSVKFFVH